MCWGVGSVGKHREVWVSVFGVWSEVWKVCWDGGR